MICQINYYGNRYNTLRLCDLEKNGEYTLKSVNPMKTMYGQTFLVNFEEIEKDSFLPKKKAEFLFKNSATQKEFKDGVENRTILLKYKGEHQIEFIGRYSFFYSLNKVDLKTK